MKFVKGKSGNPRGRPKGSRNKVNLKREKQIAKSGMTPLDYMLSVLRNKRSTAEARRWAAHASAPYVHPRLQSVQHAGPDGGPLVVKIVKFSGAALPLATVGADGGLTPIAHDDGAAAAAAGVALDAGAKEDDDG